ncbi:MAG TPA: sensor domain-containing protein [Actinocrinis sp.]|jgi:signal transduction histidine kinase
MTTVVRVLRIPFTARARRDLLYAVIALPLATLGLAAALLTVVLSLGSVGAITLLLLPLFMTVVRGLGNVHRRLIRRLLHQRIPKPVRPPRRPGVLGFLAHHLADPGTWKALGYLLLKFPLAALQTYVGIGAWIISLSLIAYPLLLPIEHDPLNFGTYKFQSVPSQLMVIGMGVVALLIITYYIRVLNILDGWLAARLLSPGSTVRIRELEETRANAINEAALTVRRIERDLHDGVQVQLVALGIRLGRAERRLEAQDPAAAGELLRDSQQDTKDIIKQLRELVRGIHPPALDSGLGPALHTLAARSSIPATARVELPERPAASVETMLYFSAAELLANAGKHSGASAVSIAVLSDGESVHLIVTDDGKGGATLEREVRDRDERRGLDGAESGSGLRGLAERVRTVDGTMDVSSPPGGPTTITMTVPVRP